MLENIHPDEFGDASVFPDDLRRRKSVWIFMERAKADRRSGKFCTAHRDHADIKKDSMTGRKCIPSNKYSED